MKFRLIMIGLAMFVLLTGRLAAEEQEPMPPPDDPVRSIEIQDQQLDLDQRRAELGFENEMRNIQLEQERMELERQRNAGACPVMGPGREGWEGHHFRIKHCVGLMLFCLVVHVLLGIWVYQDIRRRNTGSGIWIVITLMTGLFGALVYAVVRLGDKPS